MHPRGQFVKSTWTIASWSRPLSRIKRGGQAEKAKKKKKLRRWTRQ